MLKKRICLLLLIVITIMVFIPAAVSANQGSMTSSIRDSLRSEFDEDNIINTIDMKAAQLVQQARVIAGIVAVVFLILFGYSFFTAGGDPNKYAIAKSKLVGFVIALFFIFAAEQIVGGVLKLMGADL